ncbi:MAG: S8/S53 family peptidase [Actinomycetota bacterium]|nr:S8/S53 family peptidase [Actinomycetota bacterium]
MDGHPRRRARRIAAAIGLCVAVLQSPAAAADPCADADDPEYGSRECKVARLRQRPFVVIATIDTGINPYHVDFRIPEDDDRHGVHPSEYIEGFPAEAPSLNLSFDASTPAQGYARDSAEWAKVTSGVPVWMPGTNVFGAVAPGISGDFFDSQSGHGTGVASVAGGQIYGQGTRDVIILAMNGSGRDWRWAANQPWIDLISISWSSLIPVLDQSAEGAHAAAASGKISCAASGNLYGPIIFFEAQGPADIVHVGAVDPATRQRKDYSGWPVDVMALTDRPAASHNSIRGERSFGGTSAATPHLCALLARAISTARQRVGDFREGPHGGGLVVGPAGQGAFSDGVLNRLEIEDAALATAVPVSTEPHHFVLGGYGLVEGATIDHALRVMFGESPRPARSVEDTWQQVVDTGRDAVWDTVPDCPVCS